MAKYSTGGSSGGAEGDACELCGSPSDSLTEATVAGAQLQVCKDCAPHDDAAAESGGGADGTGDQESDEEHRQQDSGTPSGPEPLWDGDSSHWEEEGAGYDRDQLPYLVSDYGDRFRDARQEAGYQLEELAEELGVEEADLLAIEQGRAARAGVGGSLIGTIEAALDVTLIESS